MFYFCLFSLISDITSNNSIYLVKKDNVYLLKIIFGHRSMGTGQWSHNEKKTPIVKMPNIAFLIFGLVYTKYVSPPLCGDSLKGLRYNALKQWASKRTILKGYKELRKVSRANFIFHSYLLQFIFIIFFNLFFFLNLIIFFFFFFLSFFLYIYIFFFCFKSYPVFQTFILFVVCFYSFFVLFSCWVKQ